VDVNVGEIVAQAVPYVTAAAQAYGVHTLEKVRDAAVEETSDATVGLGRRLLRHLLGREDSQQAIEAAVADLVEDPEDADGVAALRKQLRKALADAPDLAAEIARMLPAPSMHVEASGTRAVAVQSNPGIVNTGDGATYHR
jgi:hypothetical protein